MRAVKQTSGATTAGGETQSAVEFIDLDQPPEDLLRRLDKDPRLVPYGGANFGTPLSLLEAADGHRIPNERFFVRSNGPVPLIDQPPEVRATLARA